MYRNCSGKNGYSFLIIVAKVKEMANLATVWGTTAFFSIDIMRGGKDYPKPP